MSTQMFYHCILPTWLARWFPELCVFGGLCVTIGTVHNGHFCYFDCLLTVFDHWRTNCHRSTKTVPTVYQSSKTVKQQKMTIGVPIITCLHRVRWIHKVRVCVRRIHKAGFQKSIRRWSEYTSGRRVSNLFLSKYLMQRIYIPVWYFRSSPVNFVRCSIYTCVCRFTHLRSPRADMVRNIINRPDGLINRPDKLINRPDDLLICPNDLLISPDRLINHSDNLLIRPDRLIIIHPDELINRPDDFLICPDGLINCPDRLINRLDDLLIHPDRLINCADDLLIRPDDLLHYAPCPLGGFVHTGPSQVNNFVSGSCCTLREEEGRGK